MKYLKIAVFIFNLLIWLTGFMVIVMGTWLMFDPSSEHLLNLFVKSLSPHHTVQVLSYILLGGGIVVLIVGFLGCCAPLHGSQCILAVYIAMLVGLIIPELVTAAVGGFLSYRALSGLENRLLERLGDHYGHDLTSDLPFTHSLDFAQYKFNCCGIYGDNDYNGTAWWRDGKLSGLRRNVPLTCCVLKNHESKNVGSPMSVVSRVFHKDYEKPWLHPQPKDEAACQAGEVEAHKEYRNKEGCLERATEWLRNESLKLVFLGIGMAVIQTFGIITATILCQTFRNREAETN
ncbi:CD9 antigen-like [Chelonus insularis]|uniref:CD9 antigen-like n=1 Tax=Chelonus insularis TaxID=460826 RepID=UPI00158DC73C|nr:CD9 antigen-like [Chelonus insularis]